MSEQNSGNIASAVIAIGTLMFVIAFAAAVTSSADDRIRVSRGTFNIALEKCSSNGGLLYIDAGRLTSIVTCHNGMQAQFNNPEQ